MREATACPSGTAEKSSELPPEQRGAKKAKTEAAIGKPGPFALERYFGVHEFSAKVLLSSSDVESLTMRELLDMSANDKGSLALWDNLSLGYTESQGHPDLLSEIAATYDGIAPQGRLETVRGV